jgi:hypothetical protein
MPAVATTRAAGATPRLHYKGCMDIPTLTTERPVLRPFRSEDLDAQGVAHR